MKISNITIRTVSVDGQTLEYALERKKVKNINLRIRKDGSVYASAHPKVAAERVDAFVRSKENLIRNAQRHFAQLQQKQPEEKQFLTGETVPILGREIPLLVRPAAKDNVFWDGERIVLEGREPMDLAKRQRLMDRFLDRQCKAVFGEVTASVYPTFQQWGVGMPEIRIRSMKSRWGSCMPGKGVITLNRQLLAAPGECVEYVVVHEFCHLIHPNHSRQFYQLLAMLLPNWKERKRMLNT